MKYLEAVAISALAIFAPIQASLVTVLVLILSDMITGILAARKRNEPITSAGLRRSLSKLAIYEFTLCISYVAEHFLMADQLPAMKIIAGMIGMVELKSVLENVNEISGDDFLKSAIDKLGSSNQGKGK